MDINQLRYFISVAQTLNFSEAARRNGLTQPSISHHISELEKQLGTRLFVRDKRSVSLTDTGRAFLPNALEIVELAHSSEMKLKKMETGRSGHLNISALTSAAGILYRCLRAFNAEYPDVSVNISFTSGRRSPVTINEDRFDIHFSMKEMVPGGETFSILPLGSDRLCLALPSDHPLCAEFLENGIDFPKLKNERFIAFSETDGPMLFKQTIAVCRARGYAPNIYCQQDCAEAVAVSVGAGCGIALLSGNLKYVCYAENVTLFPIEGDDARRDYVMAWHKNLLNPAVQLFTQTVVPMFKQN
ncbi:MAG: LysR family transcriptional regulator [Lachnospiraceae bacterium]|nr:LysR family transcriptional regulator [Lachnospiraceae bacterium]